MLWIPAWRAIGDVARVRGHDRAAGAGVGGRDRGRGVDDPDGRGIMPRTDGGNGRRPRYYPLDARRMAETCRKLADDLRAEHAAGWGLIHLSADAGGVEYMITRAEAADLLSMSTGIGGPRKRPRASRTPSIGHA